jgi:hypothetical protein
MKVKKRFQNFGCSLDGHERNFTATRLEQLLSIQFSYYVLLNIGARGGPVG